LPDKIEYSKGESLILDGISVIAIFNSGKTKDVTNEVSINPITFVESGVQNIKLMYGNTSIDFNVNVSESKLISIEIKKLPNKLNYFVGDIIDISGVVLKAEYDDGTIKAITDNIDYNKSILVSVGEQEIVLKYGDLVTSYNVIVQDKISNTRINKFIFPIAICVCLSGGIIIGCIKFIKKK